MKLTRKLLRKINDGNFLINKDFFYEAVVLIPLIEIDGEFHLIFQVRADNIRQGGEISFPGGSIDKMDKTHTDTAIRETCEELGIDKKNITIYGNLGAYLNPMGVLVHGIVGEIKNTTIENFSVNKDEVKEIFTVPISFFLENKPEKYFLRTAVGPTNTNNLPTFPSVELGLDERYSKRRDGIIYPVFVYKYADKIIWGITAYLTKYFIERIEKLK